MALTGMRVRALIARDVALEYVGVLGRLRLGFI